jgi:hemolysin activation/secretion protein
LTDQSVAVARLGFSRTHLFDTWQVYYGAGFSQGLKILGVTEDPDDPAADVPRAQFRKWDAAAGFIKGFKGIGTFRLDCSGQWTDTPLYSDDQLTLGSSSSVRGFTNLPEKVDRGGVLRSEFAFALPKDWLFGKSKDRMPFAWEFVGGLEPYIYADYGFGENIANDDFLARAGVGAGLRYRQGRVNIDFSYAYPIYEKGPDHRDKGPEIYLTATVKLF